MDTTTMVIGGLGGLAIGAVLGILLGRWCVKRADWWFWLLAVLITLAGIAISYVGLDSGTDLAFVGGVAFIAGALTALKYAARRIPGMGGSV